MCSDILNHKLDGKGSVIFNIWILLLSLILATMQVVGCNLSLQYGTSVHSNIGVFLSRIPDWLWCGIWAIEIIIIYFCTVYVFKFLDSRRKSKNDIYRVESPTLFILLTSLVLLFAWLPILLANLPGFFNYDISGQLIQVMYSDLNEFNSHHSLISTLVMGGIITWGYNTFGTLFAGILLYSCFQMLLCALIFAYSLYFIYQKTSRFWLVIAGFLFYGLSPTISMFAMSTTKDVICSLLLLLSFLQLFNMLENNHKFFEKPIFPVTLSITLIFAALFRKNIIFGVILYAFICCLFFVSERKKIIVLFSITIIGYFVSSMALEKVLDAVPGGVAEAYSIPFQQIGYLYVSQGEDAFTEEELEFLDSMLVERQWSQYSPFISDGLKNYVHSDYFRENKADFLSLWIKKGMQYPKEYVTAFLSLTYQAWYPGTSIYEGSIYYFDFEGRNYPVEKISYIPWLTKFCERISLDFYYQKVPVIRLFFSIGFMFWMILITVTRGLYKKQKMLWGSILFSLCVCLTCLAGPVSLVRYYLILFYAFPVHLALLFYKKEA